MTDEVRCPGCQRLPSRVRASGEIAECRQPRNAYPKRCVWRQQQDAPDAPRDELEVKPGPKVDLNDGSKPGREEPSDATHSGEPRDVVSDLPLAKSRDVPDDATRELQERLAELQENLRKAEQAASDQRAEAEEHRNNANALQLKIDEMQHASERLRTEAETQRSAAEQHQRVAEEAAQSSQSFQEKHRLLEAAKRELEHVHAQAVLQIEKLHGARTVAEQQKANLQATLDKTREEFETTLRRTQQDLETARANIRQQVIEQIKKRRWLIAGMGAFAGMVMGIAVTMMLHTPPQKSGTELHVDELLTQTNTCLNSEEWVCVGIASARILAVNPNMPVALAAQREAHIAQQQAQTAEAQKNTDRYQRAQQEKIAAQTRSLLYANQAPHPPAAAQAACPPVAASAAQATQDEAVRASLAREHAKLTSSLMTAAEGERRKGAFDCAEDLAGIAQTYGQNPGIENFIGRVRKQRQDVLNHGVTIGK